jgi:hypothetical protein
VGKTLVSSAPSIGWWPNWADLLEVPVGFVVHRAIRRGWLRWRRERGRQLSAPDGGSDHRQGRNPALPAGREITAVTAGPGTHRD